MDFSNRLKSSAGKFVASVKNIPGVFESDNFEKLTKRAISDGYVTLNTTDLSLLCDAVKHSKTQLERIIQMILNSLQETTNLSKIGNTLTLLLYLVEHEPIITTSCNVLVPSLETLQSFPHTNQDGGSIDIPNLASLALLAIVTPDSPVSVKRNRSISPKFRKSVDEFTPIECLFDSGYDDKVDANSDEEIIIRLRHENDDAQHELQVMRVTAKKEMESLREVLNEAKITIEQISEERNLFKTESYKYQECITMLQMECKSLNLTIEGLEDRISTLTTDVEQRQARELLLEEVISNIKTEFFCLEKQYNEEIENRVKLQRSILPLEDRAALLSVQLRQLEQRHQDSETMLAALTKECIDLKQQRDELRLALKEAYNSNDAYEEEIKNIETRYSSSMVEMTTKFSEQEVMKDENIKQLKYLQCLLEIEKNKNKEWSFSKLLIRQDEGSDSGSSLTTPSHRPLASPYGKRGEPPPAM